MDSLYLVSREEFSSFFNQLKEEYIDIEVFEERTFKYIKVFRRGTDECICCRQIFNEEDKEDNYYIFIIPPAEELNPPQAIRKIVLTEEEEIKALLEMLNKEIKND